MIKNLNLEKCSENELAIIKEFENYKENIDPRHYDGKNGMYRFAGNIVGLFGKPIFTDDSEETNENIRNITSILDSLDIRPSRIIIDSESIYVDWVPNGCQVVHSIEEYFDASLEFARYLDSIKCLDIKVQTGMFDDDPTPLQTKVRFNKECFDRDTDEYPDIELYVDSIDGFLD